MNNKFSIVMPNYNSNYLKRAIESVINQTYRNWELIIIDNFSNNFPEKIVEELSNKGISFFRFNNYNNIGKSRNFGIKKAKYEWIAFLDSDDVWQKEKLFEVNEAINKSDPDLIYHGMYYLPKKLGFIKKIIKDKSKRIIGPVYENLLKYGNPIANSSVVVKKKKLIEIDLISELDTKFSWEDFDCWIRLSKKNKFYFIDKILGYCWIGKGRVSNDYQSYKNCKNFMKFYKKELTKIFISDVRPKWISLMYANFFFKNRNYLRSYYFIKKIKDLRINTFLKKIYLNLILFYLSKIKKFYFIFNENFKKFFNKIIIFELNKQNSENLKELDNFNNYEFHIYKKYKEFRNCKNFFYSFNNKVFLNRFEKKHKLLSIIETKSKKIVCYGWCSNNLSHNINEINKKIYLKKGNILYDFLTLKEYRNKKLYKFLLYQISLHLEKPLYIYSLSSNKISLRAITKIGFNPIKKLNIFSNDFLQKLY